MFPLRLNKIFSKKTINQIIWFRSLFRRFHSLNQIDTEISLLLKNKEGFYIEIGANDGISQSNSLFFERQKKWRGVLVEPSPVTFDFLKSNFLKLLSHFHHKINYRECLIYLTTRKDDYLST